MVFHKILVPTDFSDFSLAAVPAAVEFANCSGGLINLLFVLEDLPSVPMLTFEHLPAGVAEQFYEESKIHAEKSLLETQQTKIPEKVRGATYVRRGPAAVSIVHVADELPADLIVMTTHGRSGLKNALLGSVTERVVRTAPCPVLTVRNRRGREHR